MQPLSLADVAERSLPGVVNISSTRVLEGEATPGPYRDPFFRHFFGLPPRASDRSPDLRERSLGSGVVVSQDGLVLTNSHVVRRTQDIRVTLSDGREYRARVVGIDPRSDMALLKLEGAPRNLHAIPFGDSDRLRLGDVVLAIGNPFGVGQTVTMGIVSAKGRADMGLVDYEDFIQTDAAINPGNSGGALIDARGRLVGINTAILSATGGYQGIGFAIPSNMVRPIMESLLRRGKVVRGWLGVAIQDLTREMAEALGRAGSRGALVADVAARTPAARAGLQRGDVITALDGEPVETSSHLRLAVASRAPGSTVSLAVERGRRKFIVAVRLGELPPSVGPREPPAHRPPRPAPGKNLGDVPPLPRFSQSDRVKGRGLV